VALVMEMDEALDPVNIGLLGANTEMPTTTNDGNAFQQSRWLRGCGGTGLPHKFHSIDEQNPIDYYRIKYYLVSGFTLINIRTELNVSTGKKNKKCYLSTIVQLLIYGACVRILTVMPYEKFA
jgi:hypothetical protein